MAGDIPNIPAAAYQQLAHREFGVYQNVIFHESVQPAYDNRAQFRALRLLWKHLTPEQRAQYRLFTQGFDHEGHSFIVRGNRSGDHYRIFENGSVLRLRDQHRFCLVLTGEVVPFPDMMLAKKLLLENDERLFLRTANDLPPAAMIARLAQAIPQRPPNNMGRRGRAFQRIRQW